MGYNLAAIHVRRSALAQQSAGKIRELPCWVDIMQAVPPTSVLTRNQAVKHQLTRQRVRGNSVTGADEVVIENQNQQHQQQQGKRASHRAAKKKSRMFRPMRIEYEEDELRRDFFRDHPWELARPRVLLESNGRDHQWEDWSRMEQPRKKLDGESVIQRQLYLLNNVRDMTKSAAYDIARREFYNLRLQEDVERGVAREEALACGAHFGPSAIEIGMKLENAAYERWKEWSDKENQLQEARISAFAGGDSAQSAEEPSETEEPGAADAAAAPAAAPLR